MLLLLDQPVPSFPLETLRYEIDGRYASASGNEMLHDLMSEHLMHTVRVFDRQFNYPKNILPVCGCQ